MNMPSPIVILRLVFFASLFYLNSLALGIAAWNIAALKSYGIHAYGPPIFVIMNALILFFFLVVTTASAFVPTRWAPRIMFECGWTGILCILQLSSALDITISGPPSTCPSGAYKAACASSTILVAITWISSSLFTIYFLGLFSLAVTHSSIYPGIWATSVAAVPWFSETETTPVNDSRSSLDSFRDEKRKSFIYESPVFKGLTGAAHVPPQAAPSRILRPAKRVSSVYDNPVFGEYTGAADEEARTASFFSYVFVGPPRQISSPIPVLINNSGSDRPPWARAIETRRGLDKPFPSPTKEKLVPGPEREPVRLKSTWSDTTTASTPALPPKALTGPVRVAGKPNGRSGSGQYESLHQAIDLPVIVPSPSRVESYGMFPEDVDDPDLPIDTHSDRSEWTTADPSSLW
ncbi:predicted protein [Sparassis crispa]|uniref:MARVEL domain-containing protein n=1 Tax=Sparassis crispa TaxID=139825 RepID=A0A401GIJ4_9APHY|nr:predicted protein [Sparassis crispa]GBE82024.1 predicted protein [Sparassis crispa]